MEQLMAMDVLDLTEEKVPNGIVPTTLVSAYAIDAHTGEEQLYFGHPRYNPRGTEAWYWRVRLSDDQPDDGRGSKPITPVPLIPTPQDVEDAQVRLRVQPQRADKDAR
jgi:hypothetical protein